MFLPEVSCVVGHCRSPHRIKNLPRRVSPGSSLINSNHAELFSSLVPFPSFLVYLRRPFIHLSATQLDRFTTRLGFQSRWMTLHPVFRGSWYAHPRAFYAPPQSLWSWSSIANVVAMILAPSYALGLSQSLSKHAYDAPRDRCRVPS